MIFVLAVTALVLGVVLAYTLWTRNFDHWQRKNVPGPKPSFPYGNVKPIFDAKHTFHDFFTDLINKHPEEPLIGFHSFFQPMLLVIDYELIKTVLVRDFSKFVDNSFILSKDDVLLNNTSFWIKGHTQWKELRSRFTPSFTTSKQKNMATIMTDTTARYLDMYKSNDENEKLTMEDSIKLMLHDSVLRIVFGIEVDLAKVRKDSSSNLAQLINGDVFISDSSLHLKFAVSFFAPWLHTFLNTALMAKERHDFFVKFINSCVQQRKGSGETRNDILQSIINVEKKIMESGKPGFSETDWASNLLTVMIDSTETTLLTFSFVLDQLARHPEEQEVLREEILQVGSSLKDFDYDKIAAVKRLEWVVLESLRIHTPVYAVGKICTETTTLGGVVVEKGTSVWIPLSHIHWSPKYHEDPLTFRPERFAETDQPKGPFMAFGEGPRACLGQRYGVLAMKVLLVGILLRYKVTLEDYKPLKHDKRSSFILAFEEPPKFIYTPLNHSQSLTEAKILSK